MLFPFYSNLLCPSVKSCFFFFFLLVLYIRSWVFLCSLLLLWLAFLKILAFLIESYWFLHILVSSYLTELLLVLVFSWFSWKIAILLQKDHFVFFYEIVIFYFSFLLHWSETSERTVLNNGGTSKHPCFITNFIGIYLVFCFEVCILFLPRMFIELDYFGAPIEMIIWFFSFHLLMQWIL